MIRQSDIAKILNISRTTVARALNGKGSINPDTKEKILSLCEELGYAKNPISTSLALKKSKSIYAFIVKTKKEVYSNILLNSLNKGEKILIIDTEDDRISSKLVFEGFYSKVMESKKCEIVGPIFQNNLKSNIDDVLENNLTEDISALYSSRFLVDIVERAISRGNENLKIVDNGFSNATKQLIKNEKVIATVAQKRSELGYLVAKYMFEYLYKDVKPKKINNEYENIILFKENLLY